MGWKDLIFASGEDENKKVEKMGVGKTSFENKFPTSETLVGNTSKPINDFKPKPNINTRAITPDNPACEPHLDKIMGMYEKGFDGLNLDGFDFYEYFKMVIEGGADNPMTYKMGFTMAKTAGATKERLLEQSNYYITEISKVHDNYVNAGNQKRQEAITSKTLEETTLKSELSGIDMEINRLNNLKSVKENELQKIDTKYAPNITEIECKLMANDIAKERIVDSIQKVVSGININI